MPRHDGRLPDQLRPVRIIPGVSPFAEGSARIEMGLTHVLCTASVEANLPPWLRGQGRGWVTAEYALLPRATQSRTRRERTGPGGRSHEIQRLIGRSLRAAIDLETLGEHSIIIDCDVLQADGGTRTASITGGYVALALAVSRLLSDGVLQENPLRQAVAAVSAGIINGEVLLDLDYVEDSSADMDCNIVQNSAGGFVEVQSTAEGATASRAQLDELIDIASAGIRQLLALQQDAVSAC